VSQAFGVNPTAYAAYGLPYHNGVDFAVITGTPVVAAAPGRVAKVQHDVGGYGLHVVLDCEKQGKKFRVIYAHLSDNAVHVSEQVTEGQIIGKSGNTGNSTGPHLHFEVRPEDASKPGSYVPAAGAGEGCFVPGAGTATKRAERAVRGRDRIRPRWSAGAVQRD
jgi:murein DD-endopeptidase MepM/ murein hydrolase activator NlpD